MGLFEEKELCEDKAGPGEGFTSFIEETSNIPLAVRQPLSSDRLYLHSNGCM